MGKEIGAACPFSWFAFVHISKMAGVLLLSDIFAPDTALYEQLINFNK